MGGSSCVTLSGLATEENLVIENDVASNSHPITDGIPHSVSIPVANIASRHIEDTAVESFYAACCT